MKRLFFLIVALPLGLCVGSCEPDDDNPAGPSLKYSEWKVAGDSFSTQNVYSADTRVQTIITGDNNSGSKFIISLPYIGPMSSGTYRAGNNSSAGAAIYFRFDVGAGQYAISPHGEPSVSVAEDAGNQRYILPNAWARNIADSTDSLIVSGTFYEPQ